jgi:serine phosphatase RsbU (regulator of sigma subunit)
MIWPTLVILTLVGCILLVLRRMRGYLADLLTRSRPDDPAAADIFDSSEATYQPLQLLIPSFGLLWVTSAFRYLFYKVAWPGDILAVMEGFAILFICTGILRLIRVGERWHAPSLYRSRELERDDEQFVRDFERMAFFAGVGLMVIMVPVLAFLSEVVVLRNILLAGTAVWELAVLLAAANSVRETPDRQRRWLVWVFVVWGAGVVSFQSGPESVVWLVVNRAGTALAMAFLLRYFFQEVIGRLSFLREQTDHLIRERRIMLDFMTQMGPQPGSADFDETFDLQTIMKRALTFVSREVRASAGAVFLRREDDPGTLSAVAVEGFYPPSGEVRADRLALRQKFLEELVLSEVIRDGQGLVGEVAATGRAVLLEDASGDPRFPRGPVDYLRVQAALILPLRAGGEVTGVLSLINKRLGDEFRPFTSSDQSLAEVIAEQAAIVLNNARVHRLLTEQEIVEHEMRIAQDVHANLLPARSPEVSGYDLGALSRAARRVGGDYFDFIWIDPTHLLLVIADVSGKGVPGAITMAMVKSALKALVRPHGDTPLSAGQLLCDLNDFVYRDTRRDAFVSMSIGILDVPNRDLHVARAGHEPIVLLAGGNGRCDLVTPDGIALGLDDGTIFRRTMRETVLHLAPGDIVALYTDGITEAMNREREMFSFERFLATLKESKGYDAQHLVAAVDDRLSEFIGDVPPHDDLTLVLLRVLDEDPSNGGDHVEKI